MRDTDWRPSACPICGKTRDAAERPVCKNPDCGKFPTTKSKQYIYVPTYGAPRIISDPIAIFNSREYLSSDKFYELGREIKVETKIIVTSADPVYRSSNE